MHLPASHGKKYFLHMRCGTIGHPKGAALTRETGRLIGEAIFKLVLCRWGFVLMIVCDNGKPIITAMEFICEKYSMKAIPISGYNSQTSFEGDGDVTLKVGVASGDEPVGALHVDVSQPAPANCG